MKITSVEVGSVATSGRIRRTVTVRVKLPQPHETMRITVVVLDDNDEALARESGVARAKDLARQFAYLDEMLR
jgi:hypothetical protein